MCQGVVKDEVMCASLLVMGTARTRLNKAGRTWVTFPVNAAIIFKAKNPSIKMSTVPAGSFDSCRSSPNPASRNTGSGVDRRGFKAQYQPVTQRPWSIVGTRFLVWPSYVTRSKGEGSKTCHCRLPKVSRRIGPDGTSARWLSLRPPIATSIQTRRKAEKTASGVTSKPR